MSLINDNSNEMSVLNESSLNDNIQNKDEIDSKIEQQSNNDDKIDVDQSTTQSNQIEQTDKSLTRVIMNDDSFDSLTKDELIKKWKEQDQFIDSLEQKLKIELANKEWYQDNEDKIKQQLFDLTRKENLLIMKLTTKEHELQEYIKQNQELKLSQIASNDQLQNTFIDPAINMIFEEMKKEVEKCKLKVEEMQNELSAWKFTPDSNTGKRLMAKCRLLYQENEELGKVISSGRIAKLEGELALQKSFSEEMKKTQDELDEFLIELEEDVEGMQSTIYHLQTQLKEEKDKVKKYQLKEENQLKDNLKEEKNDNNLNNDNNVKLTEENLINNNEQINKSDDKNDEKNNESDNKIDDNLEENLNNEPIKNGDQNNLEGKRSLDEIMEEVNQSDNECGIDSIKKHRKLESENSINN